MVVLPDSYPGNISQIGIHTVCQLLDGQNLLEDQSILYLSISKHLSVILLIRIQQKTFDIETV